MITVSAFQFGLNSDEPEIVSSALQDFTRTILQEHHQSENFGYLGRSSFEASNGYAESHSLINTLHPEHTTGVLKAYLNSSPDLEELFVLWNLPNRDKDRLLCSQHMKCFASILHCIKNAEKEICHRVCSRILRDHVKSLQIQLSSGHTTLVHSTLGILLSMSRCTTQMCKEVYNKFLVITSATLATLAQKGKELTYECTSTIKITTDARFFIILIALLCVHCSDSVMLNEILSERSVLRALTSSVHTDTYYGVVMLLEGLMMLVPTSSLYKLFDIRFQSKIFLLYENDHQSIQQIGHKFVKTLLASVLTTNANTQAEKKSLASQVLKHLHSSTDMRHREIQLLIVQSLPSMINKAIATLPVVTLTHEAIVSNAFVLDNLCQIYNSADVDSATRTFLKSAYAGEKSDEQIKDFVVATINGLFPSTFQKKEFTKLLQTSNMLVLKLSLETLVAVLTRVQRIFGSDRKYMRMETFLSSALLAHIPEVHVLLGVRSKYSGGISVEGNRHGKDDSMRHAILLGSTLRIIELLLKIIPSALSREKFDFLRCLDDVVCWPLQVGPADAVASINLLVNEEPVRKVFSNALRVVSLATSMNMVNWFGMKVDAIKMLTNLMFAGDWHLSMVLLKCSSIFALNFCHRYTLEFYKLQLS